MEAGFAVCVLCKERASRREGTYLFLRLPEDLLEGVTVLPAYARSEAEALAGQFSRRELLVSRTRETGLRWSDYSLDPDLAWMPFLADMHCDACVIMTGNRTIKQAMLATTLMRMLRSAGEVTLISLPYLTVTGGDDARKLMSESGSGSVRCLLANAMGSKRKDLTLERHILRTQTCDPDKLVSEATVTDVWNAVNGNKVAEALAALRRGRASREPLADMVVRAALCC